jgi:non-heme Fe2+,alpha-ketoglutarate-dependent halogenase
MGQRDLSFTPVEGSGARTLTKEQIDQFNEMGYCFPTKLFDEREIADVRRYLDHLFDLLAARGEKDNYALLNYHTRCEGLYDLVTNPKLLDYIEDMIGPDIICWTSHAFCKTPHDPKRVPFHQDASYWPLSPTRTVTVWLAIDDADHENSCMQLIPYTHKMGALKYSKIDPEIVFNHEIDNATAYGKPVDVVLKAGSFSLHADMTAHGSGPNRSNRRRCGFSIRYSPTLVKPLKKSWGWNAILCRGTDSTGHWTHNAKPKGDDVGDWLTYWERKFRGTGETDMTAGSIGA